MPVIISVLGWRSPDPYTLDGHNLSRHGDWSSHESPLKNKGNCGKNNLKERDFYLLALRQRIARAAPAAGIAQENVTLNQIGDVTQRCILGGFGQFCPF